MADTSFAVVYRPSSFDDYIGDETVATVKNIMSGDPVTWPHVWLLWGEKGTGKTTLGRLLAKWYECLEPTPTGPCNKCAMCQEIDETLVFAETGAECFNIRELDVATDSGKAKINEAIEDAVIPPQAPSRYKILILDECHMATKQAQNSLLKICEAPPSHLVIIFCTTNPEGMLETLYDRCTFKLQAKKANPEMLLGRLKYCCEKEKITYSDAALKMIIKKCGRNPRKSFNKLEEIAKSNLRKCDIEAVQKFTDAKTVEQYQGYIEAAQEGLGQLMMCIKSLKEKDIDSKQFIKGLPGYILDCVKVRYGIGIDEYTTEFVKAAGKLFKDYTSSQFDTLLQVVEYANMQTKESVSDEYAELILTTTGLRLSKLGYLAQGLQGEDAEAAKETKLGSRAAIELKEREYEATKPKPIGQVVSGDLIQAALGSAVSEVKPIQAVSNTFLDEDEDDEEDEEVSEEEFRKMLSELSPGGTHITTE